MYHSLCIHLPNEGRLGYFQFLAVISVAALNIYVDFCMGISFQVVWVNTLTHQHFLPFPEAAHLVYSPTSVPWSL